MQIHGLSKLTLLDFPGHVACTVFTAACNFRCPYCHNAPLVLDPASCPEIPLKDFFDFLDTRKGKLEGVCITGGEPTLQTGLKDFIKEIKDRGFLVKLDSNGYRPEVLKKILDERLADMVAMDIKNDKENYAVTAGLPEKADISPILESMRLIAASGTAYEFRTTILKEYHDAERIRNIAEMIRAVDENAAYFLQNFKQSDMLIAGDREFTGFTDAELKELLYGIRPILKNSHIRGDM